MTQTPVHDHLPTYEGPALEVDRVVRRLAAVVVALVSMVGTAHAVILPFTASLDCTQTRPPSGSCEFGGSGTGLATISLDDVSNLLSWDISWSGLSSPATVGQFYGPSVAPKHGPPQVDWGTISGLTSPSIGSTTISSVQADDLVNGLWYVQIDSAPFPGGEIRGQITLVPEPSTALLFATGLVAMAVGRRRRI